MTSEQPSCSGCGYSIHTNEHSPTCPTRKEVAEQIDDRFEDTVYDFFNPRIELAKQNGTEGEMTANRYRRMRNELKLLADPTEIKLISLTKVSEAMTESLGVMVTLGSEYRDGLGRETKEERLERERIAEKASMLFRQSCEKIYDNVHVSLERISTELQTIVKKMKRTESPILGAIRETIDIHLKLIEEQGGANKLKDQDPYKLIQLLNQMLSGYGEMLLNNGWVVEETKLQGNLELNAQQTFKKDLVFANESLYRVMLLVDQLQQRTGKITIEPIRDRQPNAKKEGSGPLDKEKEDERKSKFSQALERLLKEEDVGVALATNKHENRAREFGVYIDAFASCYPEQTRAEAIRKILEELQEKVLQDKSEDNLFVKRLKAEREFMANLAINRPDIITAFKTAKEKERERQLLTTQDFPGYDGTLFFLVSPQGMLGHLFEYMQKNQAITNSG